MTFPEKCLVALAAFVLLGLLELGAWVLCERWVRWRSRHDLVERHRIGL